MDTRRKISEPRPVCPECARVVNPRDAVSFHRPKSLRERVLEGIYCCSDCVIEAWKRGYPAERCK
jgi:hypothetical protein